MGLFSKFKNKDTHDTGDYEIDYVVLGEPYNDECEYEMSCACSCDNTCCDTCGFDEECDDESYVISPKGIAAYYLSLLGMADDIDDPKIDAFWILFEKDMVKNGYVTDEDE